MSLRYLNRLFMLHLQGGTLIEYDGSMRLLEIAQVLPDHVDDFKSGSVNHLPRSSFHS